MGTIPRMHNSTNSNHLHELKSLIPGEGEVLTSYTNDGVKGLSVELLVTISFWVADWLSGFGYFRL